MNLRISYQKLVVNEYWKISSSVSCPSHPPKMNMDCSNTEAECPNLVRGTLPSLGSFFHIRISRSSSLKSLYLCFPSKPPNTTSLLLYSTRLWSDLLSGASPSHLILTQVWNWISNLWVSLKYSPSFLVYPPKNHRQF